MTKKLRATVEFERRVRDVPLQGAVGGKLQSLHCFAEVRYRFAPAREVSVQESNPAIKASEPGNNDLPVGGVAIAQCERAEEAHGIDVANRARRAAADANVERVEWIAVSKS